MVESPAPLMSQFLASLPAFEFSHTISLDIGGVQPKVCAPAVRGERLQSNKPKTINDLLQMVLLSDLGERGRWAGLVFVSSLPIALPRSACDKLIDSSATRS